MKQMKQKPFRDSFGSNLSNEDVILGRRVRESTIVKSIDAETIRNEQEAAKRKMKTRNRPTIKHQFSQRDLLKEAIDTEVYTPSFNFHLSQLIPRSIRYFILCSTCCRSKI